MWEYVICSKGKPPIIVTASSWFEALTTAYTKFDVVQENIYGILRARKDQHVADNIIQVI